MNNAISISLFRVSGDSKSLDMIFSCPEDYYFDSLELEVRFVDNGIFKSKLFDLSTALFDNTLSEKCTVNKKKWTVRLPLDKLGITVPAIYVATLKVSPVFTSLLNGDGFLYSLPIPYNKPALYEIRDLSGKVYELNSSEPLVGYDGKIVYGKVYKDGCSVILPEEIEPNKMICSDVNHAYRCMLDDLLKEGRCDSISDDAIRKYLLLYGHQAAISVRDMETAEVYFKLIGNCFSKCANKDRPSKHVQSCNCGK